jgi:ribonuclease T1
VLLLGLVALLSVAGALVAGAVAHHPAPDRPAATATPRSTLPPIAFADLPPQAKTTLGLIDQGGPFPYAKDGTVFSNLERLLPARPTGYYREYTVPTPGSDDRGTRRLVVGTDGDIYYTDDHYASFRQVLR